MGGEGIAAPPTYVVYVDSAPGALLLVNGATAPDTGIRVGAHSLTIAHVPTNCTVSGGSPTSVTIVANTVVSDTVDVRCVASTRQIILGLFGNDSSDLYLMNEDGSNVTRLTTLGTAYHGSYSPDGKHLVFMCASGQIFAVCTMDIDGSNLRVLSGYSQFTYTPEWSPDGREIAYSQDGQIAIVRPDGSHAMTVGPFGAGQGVAWSPDARRLAFSKEASSIEQLFVMDADGSHVTQLTTYPHAYSAFPQWSPDGTKILYLSPRVTGSDIYVMNANGSDTTRVSNVPGTMANNDATWSPDGSQIAFEVVGSQGGLYVMDASGANPVNVTPPIVGETYGPNWRP